MSQGSNTPNSSGATASHDQLMLWLSTLDISTSIRNLARDFADAVLLAEVIAHFLPRYVKLSFMHVSSAALKRYNWETMEKVVLRYLEIHLSQEQIVRLASGSDQRAIECVLYEVKQRIEETLREGRYRPGTAGSRRGQSASTSRGGSTTHLNYIGTRTNEVTTGANARSQQNEMSSRALPSNSLMCSEISKDHMIQKLCKRNIQLEGMVQEKEERIQTLSRQVEKLLEIVCREKTKLERLSDSGGSGHDTELGSPNGWK